MLRAYIRHSRQTQTISVERQRQLISEWADKHNLKVDVWYIEEAVSGNAKLVDRPQLAQLMRDISKNDTLVCADMTRLSRNVMVFNMILGMVHNASANIKFADGQVCNGDDLMSMLMTSILAWTSQWEREQIAARTKTALAVVKQTKALGSPERCEWGWRNEDGKKVPHLHEQNIGKHIQQRRSEKVSLKDIQHELTKRKWFTRRGNPFTLSGISRLARTFVAAA